MERARGRKNGGADPRIVLLLGGRHDLNILVDGASAVSVSVLAGGWLPIAPTPDAECLETRRTPHLRRWGGV